MLPSGFNDHRPDLVAEPVAEPVTCYATQKGALRLKRQSTTAARDEIPRHSQTGNTLIGVLPVHQGEHRHGRHRHCPTKMATINHRPRKASWELRLAQRQIPPTVTPIRN